MTAFKPQSRFTSLLASTVARELLVAAGAALAGYQSSVFHAVPECRAMRRASTDPEPAANCDLPLAAGVLSLVTLAAIVLAVAGEAAVTTSRYGHTRETWRASLAALARPQAADAHDAAESLNPRKA